tara:strand:- start:65 stop:919 length:855 start_codon:yes stop_codon:yes gene_type:complete
MYNILFHVSGIAILEICFYFYYIGPMETKIFEKVVGKLATEMVQVVENNIDLLEDTAAENISSLIPTSPPYSIENIVNMPSSISTPISTRLLQDNSIYDLAGLNENIISGIFPGLTNNNDNNTATNDAYMKNLKDNAIEKREEKNHKLFINIVEYWSILAGVSLFIYILEHKYKVYKKLKKEKGIVPVTSEEDDIEMQNVVRYRKGSDTEETLLNQEEKNVYCTKNCKQRLGYVLHYILFGCCIIGFQYLFFENVVLKYDPLSIQEVKYLLYLKFRPLLIELGF